MSKKTASISLGSIAFILAIAPCSSRAALEISSAATTNVTCAKATCTATASNAVLNVGRLQRMLANENPKLVSGSIANDIVISTAVTWVSTHTLTLNAYHSVIVNEPVTVTGSGGLTILTDDGGAGGTFSFGTGGNVVFWDLSSKLTINGASYTLVNNIASLASDIAANPGGNYALASSYDASADGTYTHTPISTEFTGTFEGLGNEISNVTVENGTAAFINVVGSTGVIRDFGLRAINVTVQGQGPVLLGGLAAWNLGGSIAHVYTTGHVKAGSKAGSVGGLVGLNEGTIAESYSTATVFSGRKSGGVGGLVGENSGTIESSFASGKVSVSLGSSAVGGLVGDGAGQVINCYATGAVSGPVYAGGLIGEIGVAGSTVVNSYSTGTVSAGIIASDVGGVIGADFESSVFTDTYWDTTTSGITNSSQGAGNIANDPGITGLSTAQLRSGLPTGFDPSIWAKNSNINRGLPYLLAIPPS